MDNLDDSETAAKISDSAYSNSCSNSQSRRSHSSKSTHSGSNSSGSSGYGGKPSTTGSNVLPKKEKEVKKKKSPQVETVVPDVVVETEVRAPEPALGDDAPKEETNDVPPPPPPTYPHSEKGVESMEICTSERNSSKDEAEGFSCVISMHDGVVMYTTSSLITTLGYPKDMWIGRSFIDFIHPRDRSTFAAQITSGLAIPKILNGTQLKVQSLSDSVSNMVCRIRRYRGLTFGFGVKDRNVNYMPVLLKLTFKNVSDDEGKIVYLVIQATPFESAFKIPNEPLSKAVPFIIKHAATGIIEYVATESVPYLGYLPQDLVDTNALQLYHPDDLSYLRQVYEVIVKEGALPRSKAYRMLGQNGDYVRLQTEWSSFINPWSKKLEFVIGKHHIVEGPTNPDVFEVPETESSMHFSDEDRSKAIVLRETIIRVMNEVPTKPADVAKQQMSKRCQDLALFMESLMEEELKPDDELRLEIHDADNSNYERDSVMLGGISPHHDYHDSKSSTETPLSYTQLNYNETLQRYFDSHQPFSYDDYNTATGKNVLGAKEAPGLLMKQCLSPMAQFSGDSGELTSSSESNVMSLRTSPVHSDMSASLLTEGLLTKHNSKMEKEFIKVHRESRSSSKGEREKVTNENRLKKREHLARCNASYQRTAVGLVTAETQPHGVKRASKYGDSESKHHCSSSRQTQRRSKQRSTLSNGVIPPPSVKETATAANPCWPENSVNNMNGFIMGVGIPQPLPFMGQVHSMPGIFPMYYTPPAAPAATSTTSSATTSTVTMCHATPIHCMMYGQPMYGSPFIYSPMNPAIPHPHFQQSMMHHSIVYPNSGNSLGLTDRNYGLTCMPDEWGEFWRDKKLDSKTTSSNIISSIDSNTSTKALNRESGAHNSQSGNEKTAICSSDMQSPSNCVTPKTTGAIPEASRGCPYNNRRSTSEDVNEKTDGDSSSSSFYSSFFRTESGSVEESSDAKKGANDNLRMRNSATCNSNSDFKHTKRVPKRKMEPHWLEKVCVTSELIYKYQILSKNIEEVLTADKQKLKTLEQPSLVNEQLSQLYLDMQLEGVAARLTLEEGITSSSSSGEDTSSGNNKTGRRKREYSKLMMIYEEDAPLPPGDEESEPKPKRLRRAG